MARGAQTEIIKYFRGSELQNYFTKILEDDIKAIIKPQYVDHIPKAVRGKVLEILKAKDERDEVQSSVDILDLHPVLERDVASIVVSCELVLTCLRNEELCTDVPPAASSAF